MTLEERVAQTWAVHKHIDRVLGGASDGYGEQKLSGWPTQSIRRLLAHRNEYQSAVLNGCGCASRSALPETLAMGGRAACLPLPVGLGAS